MKYANNMIKGDKIVCISSSGISFGGWGIPYRSICHFHSSGFTTATQGNPCNEISLNADYKELSHYIHVYYEKEIYTVFRSDFILLSEYRDLLIEEICK